MFRLPRLGQTATSRLASQLRSSQILRDNPKRHGYFIKDKKDGEKYDQRINENTPIIMAAAFLAAVIKAESPSEAFIFSLKAGFGYACMVTLVHCPVPTVTVIAASMIAGRIYNEGAGRSSCRAAHPTLFHKQPNTPTATSNPQTASGPTMLKPS